MSFDDNDNWDGDSENFVDYDDEHSIQFADPGGNSSLRAATKNNPRNLPCRQCGTENVLTPKDRELGYCCNRCADRNESGW